MLKYSFYDCPCQNSCWKDFCNTKTFILHMEIQMLTLIFVWQRSLQTFSLQISEVAPLRLLLEGFCVRINIYRQLSPKFLYRPKGNHFPVSIHNPSRGRNFFFIIAIQCFHFLNSLFKCKCKFAVQMQFVLHSHCPKWTT